MVQKIKIQLYESTSPSNKYDNQEELALIEELSDFSSRFIENMILSGLLILKNRKINREHHGIIDLETFGEMGDSKLSKTAFPLVKMVRKLIE